MKVTFSGPVSQPSLHSTAGVILRILRFAKRSEPPLGNRLGIRDLRGDPTAHLPMHRRCPPRRHGTTAVHTAACGRTTTTTGADLTRRKRACRRYVPRRGPHESETGPEFELGLRGMDLSSQRHFAVLRHLTNPIPPVPSSQLEPWSLSRVLLLCCAICVSCRCLCHPGDFACHPTTFLSFIRSVVRRSVLPLFFSPSSFHSLAFSTRRQGRHLIRKSRPRCRPILSSTCPSG